MPVQVIINGDTAVAAANEMRNFVIALQLTGQSGAANVAAAAGNAQPVKKAAKAPIVEDDEEEEAPKAKAKAKAKPVVDEDDEDEEPAPKKAAKKPVKKAVVEDDDEDEEEEAPKSKGKKTDGKTSASADPLKDDGKEQPATVDGCRIMVRRVARAHDTDYAQAVLAEFGVEGATKIPAKKMAAFIDRCQEVIEDPDSIEVAE